MEEAKAIHPFPGPAPPNKIETTAMETSSPPPPPPPPPSHFDNKTIVAESRRIIKVHPRHFRTLSILFVPISFSPYLFPTLHKLLISPNHSSSEILIISFVVIIYSLFAFTSYLLAIGSITHSVHHAFHGTPLKLASSMESSIASFFPLLTIALLPQFFAFATLLLSGSLLFQLAGLQSELLFFLLFPGSLALGVPFAWLHLNWGLAYTAAAAAAVESRCEIGDLEMEEVKRKMGYRKLIFYYGLLMAFLVWGLLTTAVDFGSGARPGTDLVLSFLHFVFVTCFVTYGLNSVFLGNAVSFAVMYMHCKEAAATAAAAAEADKEQRPLLVSVVN